jgi:hypothetical protein
MRAHFDPINGFLAINAAGPNEQLADKAPLLVDLREPGKVQQDGYMEGSISHPSSACGRAELFY